ncbi:hypothetical protein FRC98_15695 [Lujinxingia vulgaris]|uniref:Uncharacterized protein n=1 Tax=Lujinxingia vulgaris TaxID=2600176 RepID=A0A5C6XC14_9DELT|nr:hypothetical protein [Lujinxingia vulgaris]TXD35648.1 hypothetical protein FRC98_15695 [Lujinxingia vulgaris]
MLSLMMTIPSTPQNAHANNEPVPPEEPRIWYGWQLIAFDALALAITTYAFGNLGYGAPSSIDVVLSAGIIIFALGSPALHLIHKQPWQAAWSLGLRVGTPLLGAMTMDSGGYGAVSAIGPFLGALAGAALAPLVDYALLAFKTDTTSQNGSV